MPKFLEFTTSPDNFHTQFSMGAPVLRSRTPAARHEIANIRVDGEPLAFQDESLPSRVHRSLVWGRRLKYRLQPFDCVSFVALMEGVNPKDIKTYDATGYAQILSEDQYDSFLDQPVNIAMRSRRGELMPQHTMYPAHLRTEALYIHKLGDDGPLCLTGISRALLMYHCSTVLPITHEK